MIEFTAWPKTPRPFRDMTITEKIDGANSAIRIAEVDYREVYPCSLPAKLVDNPEWAGEGGYAVYAQSRKRIITPDIDNFGFARWVWDNADTLVTDLGKGLHFGEWWGRGIQRDYGVPDKRFSLFNTGKWEGIDFRTPNLLVVPVVAQHTFNTLSVARALNYLIDFGSVAAPGFMNPEGVCIFHHASRQVFKATIDNDGLPKSLAA